jgi:hypothetical protein
VQHPREGQDREEGKIVDTGTSPIYGDSNNIAVELPAGKNGEVGNCGLPQALVTAGGGANIGNTVKNIARVPRYSAISASISYHMTQRLHQLYPAPSIAAAYRKLDSGKKKLQVANTRMFTVFGVCHSRIVYHCQTASIPQILLLPSSLTL